MVTLSNSGTCLVTGSCRIELALLTSWRQAMAVMSLVQLAIQKIESLVIGADCLLA